MQKVCPHCGSSRWQGTGKLGDVVCVDCGHEFYKDALADGGTTCPYCGRKKTVYHKEYKAFECKNPKCGKWFSDEVRKQIKQEQQGKIAAGMKSFLGRGEEQKTFLGGGKVPQLTTLPAPNPLGWIFIIVAVVIVFVPLPFLSLTVPIKIAAIGGMVFINFLLNYGHRGLKMTTFLLCLPIVFLVFTQTALGQSAIDQLGLNTYVTQATLSAKYGMCYFSNVFNVNVLSTGNLDQYCQNQVYGFQAEKQGCIDCITSNLMQRSTGIPGRNEIIEVQTSLDQTSTTAANNISVNLFDTDNGIQAASTNDKCTPDKPCTLTIYDEPVLSRFSLPLPCTDSLQYKASVSYTYAVEGQSEFKIKQGTFTTTSGSSFNVVNGKSSSGPLSFAIKSDSFEYVVGEDRNVYVNFYLYNQGIGTVYPISTTVTQTPPNKNQYLQLDGCVGSLNSSPSGQDKIILDGFDPIPPNGADIVTCQFTLPDSIKDPFLTYKFIGVTQYVYKYDNKDTVLIDLVNYPCTLTNSRWKVFSGKLDGTDWTKSNYSDDGWGLKNLPDSDWSCKDCYKYYRKNLVWNGLGQEWLNASSDDGASCYVNGQLVFDHLSEARPCGHSKRNCANALGICDPKCQQGWDYTNDITTLLQNGTNVIACAVHNIDGPGWFEVQS